MARPLGRLTARMPPAHAAAVVSLCAQRRWEHPAEGKAAAAAGGKEQAAEAAERETVAAAVAPFSPDRSLAAAAIARMEALGASQASIARQLGVHPVYLSCCALRARMPHWPCPLPDIR